MLVDPIRTSVRAFGNAVTAMPEHLYGGVQRSFEGVGKITKTMLGMF
jgi:hypothetical protein